MGCRLPEATDDQAANVTLLAAAHAATSVATSAMLKPFRARPAPCNHRGTEALCGGVCRADRGPKEIAQEIEPSKEARDNAEGTPRLDLPLWVTWHEALVKEVAATKEQVWPLICVFVCGVGGGEVGGSCGGVHLVRARVHVGYNCRKKQWAFLLRERLL